MSWIVRQAQGMVDTAWHARRRRLEARASLENPSTPLSNPAKWLVDLFGGGPNAAGVQVTPDSARGIPALMACVRVISETMAAVPLHVMERTGERNVEVARDHPVDYLLHKQPNEFHSAFVFRELLAAHVATWGNAYALIEKTRGGQVIELLPLLPDRTWPRRRDGRLFYNHRLVTGETIVLLPDQVLHIPGPGFDGLVGYSPVTLFREALGLTIAAQEFGARFFGNDARPGMVIEMPEGLSDTALQRLRSDFKEWHGGVGKAWRPFVAEGGMKVHEVGVPPEDAQFLETRKLQIEEVARIFRIPPHLIGHLEKATFSNIEQQDIGFTKHTMTPWFVRFEQEYDRKLLPPRGALFTKHRAEGLLRGDSRSRAQFYQIMRQIRAMSANEVRQLEDLNPYEGGDEYENPNIDTGAEPAEPEDDPEDDAARSAPRLELGSRHDA